MRVRGMATLRQRKKKTYHTVLQLNGPTRQADARGSQAPRMMEKSGLHFPKGLKSSHGFWLDETRGGFTVAKIFFHWGLPNKTVSMIKKANFPAGYWGMQDRGGPALASLGGELTL